MPTYAPNLKTVPSQTGTGVAVDIVDATIWGRRFVPQPFLTFLDQVGITAELMPDGYVGAAYYNLEQLTGDSSVTIAAGALPTGLVLNQPTTSSWEITGTPTTIGTYIFTLRIKRGSSTMDRLMQIIILAAQEGGAGGVGGG